MPGKNKSVPAPEQDGDIKSPAAGPAAGDEEAAPAPAQICKDCKSAAALLEGGRCPVCVARMHGE